MEQRPPSAAPHHRRTACRACGSASLEPFLQLGPTPLANAFLRSPTAFATEARYPLDVYFCTGCSLVQLLDVIDPEVLFRDYIYTTGTSTTIAAHNAAYAQSIIDLVRPGAGDLIVEIASNDGSLLQCFQAYTVRTLGVEPATNLVAMARQKGVESVNCFFSARTAEQIRAAYGPARVIIANNVLAHVDATLDFLLGCQKLLAPEGFVVVEVPYLRDLIERLEYDTIYHEHLCYFSVKTLRQLFRAAGLTIVQVEYVPIHGGSLRVLAGHSARWIDAAHQVDTWIAAEQATGLGDFHTYVRFAERVAANRQRLREMLAALKRCGKTLAAYGAPAKGNTLLNYCQIGTEILDFTVDRNPLKVGGYTPGMHLPVLPVSALVERQPDYCLLLAWNFAEEIQQQQATYRARGGRFILPIPTPTFA